MAVAIKVRTSVESNSEHRTVKNIPTCQVAAMTDEYLLGSYLRFILVTAFTGTERIHSTKQEG